MPDRFWTVIAEQHKELESAHSADDVIRILSHDRNPYGPNWDGAAGDGFFAGSGGDKTVSEALRTAGWTTVWAESAIYYTMRAPDGSMITYIEGDIYRGDRHGQNPEPTGEPATQPATYADGTPLSIQLFTIEETGLGPYVGLPVTSLRLDDTPHLFTRETAAQIAADVARDDLCMSYAFSADGTLTLQWTEDYDALGHVVVVVPDAHGRYLIGGIWTWAVWDDDVPHTDGQAAYALGAAEYRQSVTTSFPDGLSERYDQGREEAHRVTLRREEP